MEPGTSENAFDPLREAAIAGSVLTHPAYAKAGLTVAGVTDLDPARSAALAQDFAIPRLFASVAGAATLGTAVVYDIAVPPHAITQILPDLPDGAAVLIQKPMGANLSQARAIRTLCRDKGLKAAVSFQLRYSPMGTSKNCHDLAATV